jgi:5-methylcytosine-specific restriction endonuclease McrA
LIDDIANANPDQGKAIARKYVDDHESAGDRKSRYRWQRERRKVYRKRSLAGMSQLIFEGDDETVDGMLRSIRKTADALYRQEGGRDIPSDAHERTSQQRMFDAAAALLGGDGGTAAAGSSGSAPPPASQRRERPVMVFRAKLSDITDDPELLAEWEAELVGTGIVPTPVASYFRCNSDQAAQLCSETGEVLWQGRARRNASSAQWKALVARDGGCVLCFADHTMCQAHHLIPWHAPAKGETNIDQMALVCADCHHRIHDNELTLYRDGEGHWRLRAARPEEIAPKRRRPQPETNSTAFRSSEPSGSRPAPASRSPNAR